MKKTGAFTGTSSDRRIASVAVLQLLKRVRPVGMTLIVMIALMLMPLTGARASSCKITFSADRTKVSAGEDIVVTLEIEGDVVPGIFEGYVSYDASVLDYISGPECIAGGEGTLRISDMGYEEASNSRRYVLNFRASTIGSCEIAMRGNPEIYEADQGYLMSVSSNKITIEVAASTKASSDATLALIRINPGTLDPEFDPTVFEYSTTVGYETENLFVSAAPNDAHASVKIEGDKGLNVGQNRVLILVTAEDGTVKKYVIYVARAQEKTETPTDVPETNGSDTQTEQSGTQTQEPEDFVFYAQNINGEIYLNASSSYRVCKNAGDLAIPEGYSKTSVIISENTVPAYAPSSGQAGDYLLLVLEREGSQPCLYSFDRVEKTIQRLDESRLVIANKTGSGYSTIEEEELTKSYEKSMGTMTMVIAILSGACMLLLIIVIRMAIGSRNELK